MEIQYFITGLMTALFLYVLLASINLTTKGWVTMFRLILLMENTFHVMRLFNIQKKNIQTNGERMRSCFLTKERQKESGR